MGTTVRQIRRCVQKTAQISGLATEEAKLARDCVVGISKTGSCKVSDIARTLPGRKPLRETTRPLYDGLADERSGLDRLHHGWLRLAAPTADKMPFIAVDPSDITKMHGRCFDYLDFVRDASDKMIAVTGLRDEDMVLLTNKDIRSAGQAAAIVAAYMRRWGIEEGIRCWKQKTGVEDFRVRNWTSI
ncbi:MAG: transposase, partial [Polyangia bacterium]